MVSILFFAYVEFSGIFGLEMRVIARQLGLENSFRISIGFEIPEAQFSLVTKWSLRKQIEQ